MGKKWFVRKYRNNDKNGILELLGIFLDTWKDSKGRQLWEWYASNPYGYLIGLAECRSSKKIVGHMALTLTHIKIANESKLGCQAVDLLVHPDFRRQGMFLAIGRHITNKAAREQIEICYGFPNPNAHSGHLKYGWFDVADVPMFKRYVTFKEFMSSRIIKRLYLERNRMIFLGLSVAERIFLKAYSVYHKILYRVGKVVDRIEIKQVSSFGPEIDKLWASVAKYYDILVVRDTKYLNWRFTNKPNSIHQILVAQKNGKTVGYAVLLIKDNPRAKLGYILDLFARPNTSIIHSLASHSVKFLKDQKVDVIICALLAKKPFYRVLRNNAFFPCGKIPLIARINMKEIDIAKDYLGNYKNWYITLGDSDI